MAYLVTARDNGRYVVGLSTHDTMAGAREQLYRAHQDHVICGWTMTHYGATSMTHVKEGTVRRWEITVQ